MVLYSGTIFLCENPSLNTLNRHSEHSARTREDIRTPVLLKRVKTGLKSLDAHVGLKPPQDDRKMLCHALSVEKNKVIAHSAKSE